MENLCGKKKEKRTRAFLEKMEGHAISWREVKFCLKTRHPNTLVNDINLYTQNVTKMKAHFKLKIYFLKAP
jgi:hypothetical protein